MTVEEVAPSGPANLILQPGDKIVKVSRSISSTEIILAKVKFEVKIQTQ